MLNRLPSNLFALISVVAIVALACGTENATSVPESTTAGVPTPEPRKASKTLNIPKPVFASPPAQTQPGGMVAVPTKETSLASSQWDSPPPITINPDKEYTATLVMEKGGEIVIELFANEAPRTVNNFVFLAREGYYDGVTFHRVITDFMAQTGDPTGLGGGGPGYQFENELSPNLRHDEPGTVSMANKGGTATNGSQFFITYVAQPNLDGFDAGGSPKDCESSGVSCHSVFGKVVGGMDVLNGLTRRDPRSAPPPGDVITTITIDER